MSNTISSRSAQGASPTTLDAIRRNLEVWGPLALFTLAAIYACVGLVLLHGAPSSSVAAASPRRLAAAALISTTPMILALAVSHRLEVGRTKGQRIAIRTIACIASLPLAGVATVWLLG